MQGDYNNASSKRSSNWKLFGRAEADVLDEEDNWHEQGDVDFVIWWTGEVQYELVGGGWHVETIYLPTRILRTPLHLRPVEAWTGRRRATLIRSHITTSTAPSPGAAPLRNMQLTPDQTGRSAGRKTSGAADRKRAAEQAEEAEEEKEEEEEEKEEEE